MQSLQTNLRITLDTTGSPLDESAGLPKKKGKTDLFVVAVIIDEAAVGDDLTFGIGEGLDLFGFAFGDDLGAVYKVG